MINVKQKSEELHPNSKELRKAFVIGCKCMNDAILNYVQSRRKYLRQTEHHPMVMNVYDGIAAKLNAVELE